MPPKSTFIPRILVPIEYANITLNRLKLGLYVASKCFPPSMRKGFANSKDNYKLYDAEVMNISFKPDST